MAKTIETKVLYLDETDLTDIPRTTKEMNNLDISDFKNREAITKYNVVIFSSLGTRLQLLKSRY